VERPAWYRVGGTLTALASKPQYGLRYFSKLEANHCAIEMRTCAKREVSSIDAPPKPKVDVQEAIANAKVYCKQNPKSFVSLRDYSGGIYNETCAAFAAEQQVADPAYKIGSD
jgi:hypothetical protein